MPEEISAPTPNANAHNKIVDRFNKRGQAYNKQLEKYQATHEESDKPNGESLKLTHRDTVELSKEAQADLAKFNTRLEKVDIPIPEGLESNKQAFKQAFLKSLKEALQPDYEKTAALLDRFMNYVQKRGPITYDQFEELVEDGKIPKVIDMDDFVPATPKP